MKIRCLLLALLLVICCTGCAAPEKKTFSVEELRIELDDSFKPQENDLYAALLKSNRRAIGVVILREEKSTVGDSVKSADDYAAFTKAMTEMSGRTIGEIKHDGDIPYYEYTFRSQLKYRYYTAHFESEDAFWGVQFFCAENRYDKCIEAFSAWAHSVTFEE